MIQRMPLSRTVHDGIAALMREGGSSALPLVFLHGIGSNAESFEALIDCIDRPCRILAWDAPGYGPSAELAAEWPSAQDYAGRLAHLLDRVQMARVVLVGHSLGAIIAARFAASYPQRVARLALISPAIGYKVVPGQPLPRPVQARIDDLVRLGPHAFAAARARGLVHEPEHHAELVRRVESAMAAVRLPGYAQAARMLGSAWIFDDVSSLRAPTMVVCGVQDRVTPPEQTARVTAAVPSHLRIAERTVLIEDAGHAVPQQQPQRVAEALIEMIDRKVDGRD